MEKWRSRVALVTGASSGIGKAIALKLASHGVMVVACARNIVRLKDLQDEAKPEGEINIIKCDLRNEDEIRSMFEQISKDYGKIDICINNAGLVQNAPLLTSSTEKWREMIDVNVLALCICTRESVKLMKKGQIDDGFIINICSMAGHRVLNMPSSHFYMATKHMVKAITEGTNNELKACKSNIRVMQISPGTTETEFFERGLGGKASASIFKAIPDALQAENIADIVIFSLSQPSNVQICDVLVKPTSFDK